MTLSPAVIWLTLGIVFVVLEAFAAPGLGLLFTGLGALCVAIMLYGDILAPLSFTGQIAWFLGFTAFWAVVLWKPIKKFRMPSRHSDSYSNMVGETVVVMEDGLAPGQHGRVKWSGAIMNAELAHDAHGSLAAGAQARIVEVRGNTLIVK